MTQHAAIESRKAEPTDLLGQPQFATFKKIKLNVCI